MRTTIQIKTGEFEYIMQEVEVETPEAAVEAFRGLKVAYNANKERCGMLPKLWNAVVDEYLKTGTLVNGTELYQEMNDKQRFFFQELKKSNKRLKIEG